MTDARIHRAICAARALFRGIFEPKGQGIDAELLAEFIDEGFRCKGRIGRPRRAIGHGPGFVDQDLVTVDQHMGDIVGRENTHRPGRGPTAGKTARFVAHIGLGSDEVARFVNPHFAPDNRTRGRTGRLQNFRAAHDHLDGPPGLFGQNRGQGFEINANFAPKPTANLHRHDLHL